MTSHKYGDPILKILILAIKWRQYWIHGTFFAMTWPKSKIFNIASPNLSNFAQGSFISNFKSLACFLFK